MLRESPRHGRPLSRRFRPRRCAFGPILSLSHACSLRLDSRQHWQQLKPPYLASLDICPNSFENLTWLLDTGHTRPPRTPERGFCPHNSIIAPVSRSSVRPFQCLVHLLLWLTIDHLPSEPVLSIHPAQRLQPEPESPLLQQKQSSGEPLCPEGLAVKEPPARGSRLEPGQEVLCPERWP